VFVKLIGKLINNKIDLNIIIFFFNIIMAEEQKIGSPTIMSDDPVDIIEETDSDSDSDDEDLKKLENFESRDILVDFHPHLQHISNKEMYALSKVIKDKSGKIVDPLHKTLPILTRYEKAKIIGLRAKQINNGAQVFIDVPHNVIEGLTIAEWELKEKKVPFIIRRPLPNGGSEYWKVADLEMLE
jgi:DNA-directed RNA polymerase subunit K/omega